MCAQCVAAMGAWHREISPGSESLGIPSLDIRWVIERRLAFDAQQKNSSRRSSSWCCNAPIIEVQGPLVLIDDVRTPQYNTNGRREWAAVIVLLCRCCKNQMHGEEYVADNAYLSQAHDQISKTPVPPLTKAELVAGRKMFKSLAKVAKRQRARRKR